MSHMVIFQTPDGNPGYNQFDTVDESVSFVEKLRNEQNVLNARIFKLEELKFEFKPYFRVELAALGTGEAAAPAPAAAPVVAAVPASAPAPSAPPAPASPFGSVQPAPESAASSVDATVRPIGSPEPAVGSPAPNGSSFAGAPADDERGRRGLFGR